MRARDHFQRRQLAGYEQRQFLQALGFHQHQQVVAAAHQIDALDLLEAVNPACHSVKAHVALRRYADLNHRLHALTVGQIPVDGGRVVQDDASAFQTVNCFRDFLGGHAQHHRQLFQRQTAVLPEQVKHLRFQSCHSVPFLSAEKYTFLFYTYFVMRARESCKKYAE